MHVKMVSLNKEKLTDYEDYTQTETDENRLTTKCFRKCACDSRCGLHTPSRAGCFFVSVELVQGLTVCVQALLSLQFFPQSFAFKL